MGGVLHIYDRFKSRVKLLLTVENLKLNEGLTGRTFNLQKQHRESRVKSFCE